MLRPELHNIWNLEKLAVTPEVYPTDRFTEKGLQALFYSNVPYKGRETRVFAWYGCPEWASAANPAPGIVAVHGGGGTAFADWCHHWINLGFAVIAMDNCGGTPCWSECPQHHDQWPRHDFSGPDNCGCESGVNGAIEDQWIYHAVSSVLRAKKFLEARPEVQKDNISINGISWGAVLSCIAISLDSSFRCAVPVYGCGFFDTPESNLYRGKAKDLDNWFALWDPAHYLPENKVPTLFVVGTEDVCFPTGEWMKTTKLPQGKVYRSLRPDYFHDHLTSRKSNTIKDFVQSYTTGTSVPEILYIKQDGSNISAAIDPKGRSITKANLYYTRAAGAWMDRRWNTLQAELKDNTVTVEIPRLTTACYVGIYDEKNCFWTTEIIDF